MEIRLHRKSPLGLKDQIKRQIRIMMETGELSPAQALPSAKDLAVTLNVNRNTVSTAYRELAAEGLLMTFVGSGTFIQKRNMRGNTTELQKIVDKALEKAVQAGFSPEQITDFLLHRVSTYFPDTAGRRVLVVECNQEAINHISKTLKENLSLETTGILIQDLEADPSLALTNQADLDLIVCGLNHLEELKKVVPKPPVEVVAVMLKADIRLMHELMQLPAGTTVGFVCATQRSTETFYREAIYSGGSRLIKVWVGMDNLAELGRLLKKCKVIFASHYVYDRIIRRADSKQRIIKIELTIDQTNIRLIQERLTLGSFLALKK